ncbi:hypothetical protein LCGC14_0562780 [marine sediment metagenome]|uniref:Uncharacterized protein n=1 Tax=marine sediment metagenome TaxID=412755 RepID=A0A0F9S576_9ZZZZ
MDTTENNPMPEPLPTRGQVSAYMARIGRRGGKKGGKRSMETMTPEERSARASNAVKARWDRYYEDNPRPTKARKRKPAKKKARKRA